MEHNNLTRREQFALAAMQAIIIAGDFDTFADAPFNHAVTKKAFKIADAMIDEANGRT